MENAYRVARITARPRAVIIGQFIEYALSNFVVSLFFDRFKWCVIGGFAYALGRFLFNYLQGLI